MAKYRVEIGYRTKRESICLGMEIEAFNDTEAEEKAIAKHVTPYPARKWMFTRISEATIGRSLRRRKVPPSRRPANGTRL